MSGALARRSASSWSRQAWVSVDAERALVARLGGGCSLPLGAYAEQAVVPAWRLVRVPRGIDARTAAAAMLQGMTAHYLSHSTYPLKAGHTALIHAAAGGVRPGRRG